MVDDLAYNPLDKLHLGESVANAILRQAPVPLPPAEAFAGAGIYMIYYTGPFAAYKSLAVSNRSGAYSRPIYVGKAIPQGGRRGRSLLTKSTGRDLYSRLSEHATSIQQARNLDIADFKCRYLVVDDIWIPLGESLLISQFKPVWNAVVDGFGNHSPGKGRFKQRRSMWDILHPGRPWADLCAERAETAKDIEIRVISALSGG
ncbi:MAG: Eco29kI family restriction endonuclease [Planctomycetaceae bacterium]